MEKVTFRACDYKACPSATISGENVAKIALAIVAVCAIGYVAYKLK